MSNLGGTELLRERHTTSVRISVRMIIIHTHCSLSCPHHMIMNLTLAESLLLGIYIQQPNVIYRHLLNRTLQQIKSGYLSPACSLSNLVRSTVAGRPRLANYSVGEGGLSFRHGSCAVVCMRAVLGLVVRPQLHD